MRGNSGQPVSQPITRRDFLQQLGVAASVTAAGPLALSLANERSPKGAAFDVLAGRPMADSVALNVIPASASPWIAEWGTDPQHLDHASKPVEAAPGSPFEITLAGLSPSSAYHYRVRHVDAGTLANPGSAYVGKFHTQRRAGEPFEFTITSDSHLTATVPRKPTDPLIRAVAQASAVQPDFHITLGDEAMQHSLQFVAKTDAMADLAYAQFRGHYRDLARVAPLYYVLGNHEAEGWIDESFGMTRKLAERARRSRQRFVPNPCDPGSALGGSEHGNYFAWPWGDALFVALDPYTYSSTKPKRPEDWTLGAEQLRWFERVLGSAKQKWKFVLQHQLVGGSDFGGPYGIWGVYANYGRGGARYAKVGEQAAIHDLMKRSGAQVILKGHDHIFVDEIADGIHYTTCGRLTKPTKLNAKAPPWANREDFRELYPNGWDASRGYLRVRVTPETVTLGYFTPNGERRGGYTLSG